MSLHIKSAAQQSPPETPGVGWLKRQTKLLLSEAPSRVTCLSLIKAGRPERHLRLEGTLNYVTWGGSMLFLKCGNRNPLCLRGAASVRSQLRVVLGERITTRLYTTPSVRAKVKDGTAFA